MAKPLSSCRCCVGRRVVGCWPVLSPAGTMIIIPAQLVITRDEFHQLHPAIMSRSNLLSQRKRLSTTDRCGSSIVTHHLSLNVVQRAIQMKKNITSFKFLLVKKSCRWHPVAASPTITGLPADAHFSPCCHQTLNARARREKDASTRASFFPVIKIQYAHV